MSFQRLLVGTDEHGITRIALNRPERRNALDALTVEELKRALTDADANEDTRVVLLTGNGPDFCAGADLDQLERIASGGDPLGNLDDAAALGDLFIRMRRTRVPVVAAVHGNAIAGGAGLATAADLIVAADDATFGYPEVNLGFVPAMVLALLRRSVGEKIAFDLAAGGHRFDAREAYRLGLVNRIFPAALFDHEVTAFAAGLAARSASALRLIKRLLYGIDGASFDHAIERGAEVNVIARSTPDFQEGVRRFLQRRRE